MSLFTFGKEKKRLLEWQKLLTGSPSDKLVLTKSQLEKATADLIYRQCAIANDCVELINSTANPKTFFERYDLYMNCTDQIIKFSQYMTVSYSNVAEQRQKMIQQYPVLVEHLVYRAWAKALKDCDKRKTEKGKFNRKKKFIDDFEMYQSSFPEKAKEILEVRRTWVFNNNV